MKDLPAPDFRLKIVSLKYMSNKKKAKPACAEASAGEGEKDFCQKHRYGL